MFNCRYIRHKTQEVIDLLIKNEVDVLIFQVIWLKNSYSVLIQEVWEYSLEIFTERKIRASDIRRDLTFVYTSCSHVEKVKLKQYPSFETQVVQIPTNSELLTIGNVYLSGYIEEHMFKFSLFLEEFQDFNTA